MTNAQILHHYLLLQYQIMFNRLIDLDYASIAWSKFSDDMYFNYALVDQEIHEKQLVQIESEFNALDRKPSIYFEHKNDLAPVQALLLHKRYKNTWNESWMFYNSARLDTADFNQVRKVENENDLETFLSTFDSCYKKNDPQNPYGELGKYIDAARFHWHKHHATSRLEYFVVFERNNPVAVSALTNFSPIGYISNVGSLPSVRGKGYGKIASLYAVSHSAKNGNTHHILITEEGQYPHEFYTRVGFETRFIASGFTKKTM